MVISSVTLGFIFPTFKDCIYACALNIYIASITRKSMNEC